MSYASKFGAAAIGLLVMAFIAGRQLFLLAAFRDAQGLLHSQGGKYHLWLAFSAGITACVAGGLMFHFFLRHERDKNTKVPLAPMGPLLTTAGDKLSANSPTGASFDPIRWVQLNRWLAEGQADDRTPMDGSVKDSAGTPSAQRAFARRSHQLMFKKWSQARHD